ncbi:helix-turn-helix domain-containing protein [Faucicola boevrei]|uniref:helix-turn-helix domain-containing protein n=1 Tax=Faucicola boevrei TaxID=346665 RepID=UPI0003748985|nr:helix-turn-helix domain-containing protein [Moraxella boevrei]
MSFISHDEFIARLPKERQERIQAKAEQLKQAYELSQLRQTAKLSQSELAVKMGVSQANISKIENGKDVHISTLKRYIKALGGDLRINAIMPTGEQVAIV